MGRYVVPPGSPFGDSPFSHSKAEDDMKKLWLRPVHDKNTDRPMSIAVCTTKHEVLVDEQILEHFSFQTSGKDIRECYPEHTLAWASPILVLT